MILKEIVFMDSERELRILKGNTDKKVHIYVDDVCVFEIDIQLASLIGDCLSHIGKETDFLGLRSHLEY